MIAWLTRFSIRTRMVLLVLIGLLAILAVISALSAEALHESTQAVFDERLRLAQLAAVHIDEHLVEDVLARLERVAQSEGFDLTDTDPQPERRALRELYAAGLFAYDVFVTDARGVVLLTEPDLPQVVGADLSADPHVREALATGEPRVSGLLTAVATGQPLVSFVVPVVDEMGAVAGLIGGATDPASPSFAAILSALRPAFAGRVELVDRGDMVLASTDPARVSWESGHKTCLEAMFREEKAMVGTYPRIEGGVEKGKDVIAFAPLSAAPWAVTIEQPEAEALAPVYALRRRLILVGAVTMLVTVILTWLTTQAVVVPLSQLLAASRRIASGDLGTPVPELGRDEVGDLGRGFEAMRQQLAARGQELESAVRERTRQLSALYAIDRVAAQSLDLEEILHDSLDKVLELLEVEAGAINLVEPDGETLRLWVHRGLSEEFVQAVQRMNVGEGVCGRAAAEGKSVLLDVRDYPTERLAPFVVKEGLQALVSAPLVSKGVVLGALTLGTRRPRAFLPEEMELLTAIGQQLGQAVENARLYQETRGTRDYLEALIASSIDSISTTDEHGILTFVSRESERILGYPARELLGQPLWKYYVGGKEEARKIMDRLLHEGHLRDYETEFWNRDGYKVPVSLSVSLLRDTQGRIVGTLGVGKDITERKRAEAELQRRVKELSILNQIGRALATTLDLDELMEVIYQQVTAVMEADAFFIALYDREADELDYRIRVDQGVQEPAERRAPGGVSGLIVSSGQPILIRDFERERDQYPQVKLWGTMEAPASWLGVPMVTGERVVGLISVQAYRPAAYDEGHQALLSTIAAQAALAVESAWLYQQAQEHAARLERVNRRLLVLQEITASLTASFDVKEILRAIHANIGQVLDCEAYTPLFGLLDERDQTIYPYLVMPDNPLLDQVRQAVGWPVEAWELPVSRIPAPLRESLLAGEPFITDDVADVFGGVVSKQELAAAQQAFGVVAVIVVPLMAEGRLVGAMTVFTRGHVAEEELAALRMLGDQAAIAIQNARLFEETRQKSEHLAVINRLDRVISASLDIQEVYETFMEEVARLVSFDHTAIVLLDEAGEQWEVLARWTRAEPVVRPGGRGAVEGTVLEWLLEHREPWLEGELGEKGEWRENEVLRQQGVRSRVLLPLMAKGRMLGLLTFGSFRPHTYSECDLEVLLPIADQMAIAVENSRLYQATERRLVELTALFEVSAALRGATTVEEMLPIILDKTLEVVSAEAGVIFLVDEAARQMVASVAQGLMEEALVGRRFPLAGSVIETILQTREPDISLDLAADPRMPEEMRAMLRGGESGIGLPLRAAGVPVGMMAVSWLRPHAVTDEELRLLTAIADMAANAVHRASLFEELEYRVHELEALFEVGQAITVSLRVQDVLDLVVRVAPQAVHAEGCYLFLWDEDEERLVLRAVEGFSPETVGQVKYRLGEGLTGWVFLEGRPANVPNVAVDPRWKRHPEHETVLPSGRADSVLVVPLIVGDKTLGVLGVVNKTTADRRQRTAETTAAVGGRRSAVVSEASTAVGFTAADESLLTALAGQVAVAIESARLYEDVRGLSLGAIRSLATAIDARDPYTRGHSEGVTELTVRLARELGWNGADLEMLEFAALLHDVGKIGIPDAVLRKKEPLTADDWNLIYLHPYHSAQMVKPVEALYRIVPWVYHHQEKWDGTGYPDGLKGEEIPLASRIIAVADAYNAMTTERPYRRARSREEAVEELRCCAGTQFDPQVVEAFLRILDL